MILCHRIPVPPLPSGESSTVAGLREGGTLFNLDLSRNLVLAKEAQRLEIKPGAWMLYKKTTSHHSA
ncbi:hypothetical protein GN956_G7792 [Arapaima gigas]